MPRRIAVVLVQNNAGANSMALTVWAPNLLANGDCALIVETNHLYRQLTMHLFCASN